MEMKTTPSASSAVEQVQQSTNKPVAAASSSPVATSPIDISSMSNGSTPVDSAKSTPQEPRSEEPKTPLDDAAVVYKLAADMLMEDSKLMQPGRELWWGSTNDELTKKEGITLTGVVYDSVRLAMELSEMFVGSQHIGMKLEAAMIATSVDDCTVFAGGKAAGWPSSDADCEARLSPQTSSQLRKFESLRESTATLRTVLYKYRVRYGGDL